MTNHEIITSLSEEELSKTLTTFKADEEIGDDWCRSYCEHRLPNLGCKLDDCIYQEEAAVIAWLKAEHINT
jgi:hypothetical protein